MSAGDPMPTKDIPRSNAEVRNEFYSVYAEIYAEMDSNIRFPP